METTPQMHRPLAKLAALTALAAAFAAGSATADVTLRTVSEKDGTPWTTSYVAGGKIRFDSHKGTTTYMLWHTGATTLTTVMPERRSYMVLDPAQVAAGLKQAQAAMANIPPAVREMMKKQGMGGMAGGKPLIEMKFTKTGKTMNKAGFTCSVVDLTITGVPEVPGMPMPGARGSEFCVVDPAKLGIPAADMQTFKAMAEFTKRMTKDIGQLIGGVPDADQMGGMAVWSRDKGTGEAWVMKPVEKSVSGVDFAVPAGFKQETMPSMDGMPAADPAAGGGKKKKKKNG